MEENYPDIELIKLQKNFGFSKAVNIGIQHSRTPYVILLNNDTTVDTRYVEEMVKAIEKSPKIFSVSSKMIQMYHPELIDSAGDLYTLLGWGSAVAAVVQSPITKNMMKSSQPAPELLFIVAVSLMKSAILTRIILLI